MSLSLAVQSANSSRLVRADRVASLKSNAAFNPEDTVSWKSTLSLVVAAGVLGTAAGAWQIPNIVLVAILIGATVVTFVGQTLVAKWKFRKYLDRRGVKGPNDTVPASWREQLLTLLFDEGVTQVPDVARGEFWLYYLPRFFWLPAVIFTAALFIDALQPQRLLFSQGVDTALCAGATALAIFAYWRAQPLRRRFATEWKFGRNASRAVQLARQPPILFLRSFSFDSLSSRSLKGSLGLLTPESTLVIQASRLSGPVIAIGRPGETMPPPGALRIYVTHEQWEVKVRAIIPLCQLVIWVTGYTEGLQWELRELVNTVSPRRLVVWLHLDVGNATLEQREREWTKFVAAYSWIFPKPLPAKLGKTYYLAFDNDWSPICIPGPGVFPLTTYLNTIMRR